MPTGIGRKTFLGKHHSEESKRKMSKFHKGKHHSPTTEFKKGQPRSKNAHNLSHEKGQNCVNWRGGRIYKKDGYVLVYAPNHPFPKSGNYVLEHRLVIEKHLGRFLNTNEYIHHKNGIKDDNRLKNLELTLNKSHFGKVRCPYCLKHFLIK